MPWRLFTCPVGHFAEQIFGRNQNFGPFELGVQNYWTAKWSNTCCGVGKTAIHAPRETFWVKWIFFQKNISLNLFSDFGREIPEFLRNFSPRVSKPFSKRQKTLLNKFRNIFSQEFWRKHWSGLKNSKFVRIAFYISRGTTFWEKPNFVKFRALIENWTVVSGKIVDRFAKNAFQVTRKSFWEKWSFCRRKK